MKYSEIRDWVINYIEHCSKEDMVELYEEVCRVSCGDVEWDE